LRLNSGKLLLASDDTETIRQFSSLTDKSIEEEAYTKGIFNSMYVVFYGSDEWNKDGTPHLSGCQILQLNLQLISIPDNHMYLIYEQLLKEETERIAKKYFPTEFNDKGFVASLAIKIALLIIVFRSENFLPNDETPEVTWFSSGTMLDGLNYAVKESTSEKGKKLSLKKWFLDYYTNELEKRIAFIRLQVDNNIGIFQIRPGVNRVFYLPVFESFKFFCADSPNNFLPDIIRLFQNRQIGSEIKDDILVNFVINIQKIIGQNGATQNQPTSGEKEFKDLFILLISEIFKNLTKKIIRSLKIERTVKKYYEESYGDNDWRESDLLSDANLGMIEMILNFDLSKNNSFIGYIASGLRFKIISGSRIKKNDELTISERELAEDFWENIPEISDFIEKINDQQNIAQIRTFIDSLPEKQREAVKKFAENNEKLSDSERKNKNRGLDKIKEMMSSP
jgi:DNA-directed RNA polymerase specialized sigma subunit